MLRRYLALPPVLRTRAVIWTLLALCALCVGVYALIYMNWMLSLPMLCVSAATLSGTYALLSQISARNGNLCKNSTKYRPQQAKMDYTEE